MAKVEGTRQRQKEKAEGEGKCRWERREANA